MKLSCFCFAFTAMLVGISTQGYSASPAIIDLQSADGFSILAGSGITNTGFGTISGYVGSYPTSSQTGFNQLTLGCVNHFGDPITKQAKLDLTTAYNDAMSRPFAIVPTELGGTTLAPGVYRSAATDFYVTGTLTLDAGGNPNAVFIFQTPASTLGTANNAKVVLINGARAENVFWAVGSSATLSAGTQFVGTIMSLFSITLVTGAKISGRLLAQNGGVTLDTVNVATTSKVSCNANPSSGAGCDTYFYPSPARGEVGTAVYSLQEAGDVTLRVYNQTGRLVDTITEPKPAGCQTSNVTLGQFGSGTYLYVVSAKYASGASINQSPGKFVVLH